MFIITFGDFVGGIGGIVLVVAVLLFIIFLCKGGINLNYALGISLVFVSLVATILMLGEIFKKIKKGEKKGFVLLALAIITAIVGYFIPFQAVFMTMKFNGIFSSLIYEMILSIFLCPILYDINKGKISEICYYLFKNLVPMFFMTFGVVVFVVMFLYAGGDNEKGWFKKFIDSGMTYNSVFFDKARKDKTMDELLKEMFLEMDKIKDNSQVNERVYNACKRDLIFQDQPCRAELDEKGTISEKNYFRALLYGFNETVYKEIGKKSGYFISESKELADGTFALRIADQKQMDIYFYQYDYDNKVLTKKDYEFWNAYMKCEKGVCSYGER